jgi:hypothetical protein
MSLLMKIEVGWDGEVDPPDAARLETKGVAVQGKIEYRWYKCVARDGCFALVDGNSAPMNASRGLRRHSN